MRYKNSFFLLFLVAVLGLTIQSCTSNLSGDDKTELLPESGETLLPNLASNKFIGTPNKAESYAKSTTNSSLDWAPIERLLQQAQDETKEELIAVFSVRDSMGAWYNYYLQPLSFSPDAMEQANGETQLFIYELNSDDVGSVPRIAIAQIPKGEYAFKEMEAWIVPKLEFELLKNQNIEKGKSDFYCNTVLVAPAASACWPGGCSYYEPIYDVVCEGSPSGNNDGGDDSNWDWPVGGGGSPGGGSGGGTDECRPPFGCETAIYFYGEIIIDRSVIEDQKVRCVLNKLLNNGNTLAETMLSFADESIDIDLKIELTEVSNNDLGSLNSIGSSNIFTLQIDKSNAQTRLPIQIATTIMHEAIHAEMRRYLYGATNVSTLPGFPGSFAEDWNAYVISRNGTDPSDNASIAEHGAMAQDYIGVIADGLQEFDNFRLSRSQYEALAWEGLIGTPAYANLNISQRNRLGTDYQTAENQSSQSCN